MRIFQSLRVAISIDFVVVTSGNRLTESTTVIAKQIVSKRRSENKRLHMTFRCSLGMDIKPRVLCQTEALEGLAPIVRKFTSHNRTMVLGEHNAIDVIIRLVVTGSLDSTQSIRRGTSGMIRQFHVRFGRYELQLKERRDTQGTK